jgi:deazaflavin-dependent oxidoreductase (nitroreductase family)
MSEWNKAVITEFRANEGKVGGRFANRSLLLLHTTGAKSGLPRVNPLVYMADGDRLVIVASKGGAPTHPDWYHNVVANPQVEVEVGTERFQAVAAVMAEPDRTDLYRRMAEANPFFAEYERKTTRVIPVIALMRQE